MNMLDLGCGTGRHALFFAKAGLDVTAVDSSVEALSVLQKQSHEEGVTIKIIKGEYSQDLFATSTFDFVLAFNVLYHGYREDFMKAVSLIHKWLRPGGLFFFTCLSRRDGKYGSGGRVAPNTYKAVNSIHPGDIHYFSDRLDIIDFLQGFTRISHTLEEHYWDNNGISQFSSYIHVLAIRQE